MASPSPVASSSTSHTPSVQALFPPLHIPPPSATESSTSIEQAYKVDESCLSFCAQRTSHRSKGIEPMCSMICWRKRPPTPPKRSEAAPSRWDVCAMIKAWADQRSIVYVRGTPNGVYGCYLEEMSEPAPTGSLAVLGRGKEQEFYTRQWGDDGAIMQLPLSVVLSPLIKFPHHVRTVAAPPINLVKSYTDSFASGAQRNALEKFWQEVENGGALKVAGKGFRHWVKRSQDGSPPKDDERSERRGAGEA